VVWSVDRLARSIRDLRDITAELLAKGVSVRFEKDGLSFAPGERATAAQNLQLNILGVFAEFERNISKERQAEGIVEAKKKGTYRKRKKRYALSVDQIEAARERVALGVAVAKVAGDLGVSCPTLYKAMNDDSYGSQPDIEAIDAELMDEMARVMVEAAEQYNAEAALQEAA
jgi:DNA invertase Pin-like site-specific DNA recombinase